MPWGEAALQYPSGHSDWLNLALNLSDKQYEIAIGGAQATELAKVLQSNYLPNCIFCAGEAESLPLLKNRLKENETLIYICKRHTCLHPVKTIEEAMKIVMSSEL